VLPEDIDEMFTKATAAQKTWKLVPINERAEKLLKAADFLEQHKDTIAQTLIHEVGKPRKVAEAEVTRTADLVRYLCNQALMLQHESFFSEQFPKTKPGKIVITYREPLGTVLAMPPFNYPINLAATKIIPALLMGNACVVKPPTQGSISCAWLIEACYHSGISHELLAYAPGRGSEIGDYIVQHPASHAIIFTGSAETGRRIAQKAGMKQLIFELGGKDAAIVCEDADLKTAAQKIVNGAFSFSGQRCTAVKRVLVVEKIADEFVQTIIPLVKKLKVGNPLEEVDVGPVVDDRSAEYIHGLVDDARKKGATFALGGERTERLFHPTVIDHVTPIMKLAWEEPFGPVLPIIRVKNAQEAINLANHSEYGLQASVFTENIDNAFLIAKQLEVGSVQINGEPARGPDHLPFIGIKNSGMGPVQGARFSLESVSRVKSIVFNLKNQ
jgi:glyceraldehyde-3-phosphate dehydrogenase (NADP+)